MKKNILLATILLLMKVGVAQIPIDFYKSEISNLKTEKKINSCWKKIKEIDQVILIKTNNNKLADSISIDNMVRTALLFKIHGEKIYRSDNIVPILNMAHSHIGGCQIAFWPIIKICSKIGGVIENFGGKYPAYQLEGIALSFYSYSLLNQESKYNNLIKKLNSLSNKSIVDDLITLFKYQKELHQLSEIRILNKWNIQPFKNLKEDDFFEFVLMSDHSVYLRKYGRIQKLNLIDKKVNSKIYQIENEPFGWTYEYSNSGTLCLKDENGEELIVY